MITAQIASLPERSDSLKKTIESLLGQVDKIHIGLNNYYEEPSFCKDSKISTVLLDNSTGDAAKFYNVELRDGFFFSCDDDIIYPADYVKYMTEAIQKYKCIVTLHGRSFYNTPIANYYTSASRKYRCLGDVEKDIQVNVGGSGVMAFHTDDFHIKYSDFKAPNMADVWVAKKAHEQGVPIMVLKHRADYLGYIHPEKNIYDEYKMNCTRQTEIINSFL